MPVVNLKNQTETTTSASKLQNERRRLLIDATMSAIFEHGLSNLTLAKIASIAGLTAGSVNFHFDSKEALLLETLNFVAEELDQNIAAALQQAGNEPAQRLLALVDASLDSDITEPRKVAVWHAFSSEGRARQDYQRICGARDRNNFNIILNLCSRIVDEAGKQTSINARAIANATQGLIDEVWQEILFAGDTYDREHAHHICLAFLASVFPWCFEMPPEPTSIPGRTNGHEQAQHIVEADETLVDELAPLFQSYRQRYQPNADPEESRNYLLDHLRAGTSTIYLAFNGQDTSKHTCDDQSIARRGQALGFAQLYPGYCSVAAAPIWTLFDLYVAESARRQGIGHALLLRAKKLATETGAARLELETEIDNYPAQSLYESHGYKREPSYYKYILAIP